MAGLDAEALQTAAAELRRRHAAPEDAVLLLHGMGGTPETCRPLVPYVLSRRGVHLVGYDAGDAGDPPRYDRLARSLLPHVEEHRSVRILGHSLGGVVALHLAALAPDRVTRVVALGVKVTWSQEELDRAAEVAARPMRVFETREAAVERAVLIAGLHDLRAGTSIPDGFAEAAVERAEGGWRPVFDPRLLAIGDPGVDRLLRRVSCDVVMARGEHDPMVSDEDLAGLVDDHVTLHGVGHHAHVEDPAAVAPLLRPAAAA